VVYGSTYQFKTAENLNINVPRWYQYCLGIDLINMMATFAINTDIKSSLKIAMLVSNNSDILRSRLIAYNEMFSYVNIHSTNINR
jgi:hypothetical protein